MAGLIDKPIEKKENDYFEVKKYIDALSKFIEECDTPMTIAVQGDWGSGKTSIMNMVKNDLGDKVHPLWFNTWQFSKFNMDDKLSFSLLLTLADQLDQLASKSGGKKELKTFMATFVWKILSYTADVVGASKMAEDAFKIAEKMATPEYETLFSAITSLKEYFQKTINQIAKDGKKIVIFIDDLDRLEPLRALDVLEVLKLFLDCENCVYVLAIDYGVVSKGVNKKYGDDLQGKQFFDKIIQLPFYMPVAYYNIEGYVKQALGANLNKNVVSKYVNLIRNSVGCNPRTMKRLFNSFELISMIYGNKGNEEQRTLLFALLCFQLTYEDVYNYLVENIDTLSAEDYNSVLEDTNKIDEVLNLIGKPDEKREEIHSFMVQLLEIMLDGKEEISANDVETLKNVLNQSTTTNNTAVMSRIGKAELTEDKTDEKTLTATDKNYGICCLRSGFQLGYGQKITVEFRGKLYEAKMHKTSTGRIDGLSTLYKDNEDLHEGDKLKVQYKYNERKVILEKI